MVRTPFAFLGANVSFAYLEEVLDLPIFTVLKISAVVSQGSVRSLHGNSCRNCVEYAGEHRRWYGVEVITD